MNAGKHEILLATHNPGKVEEMERLLTHLPVHWLTLADIGVETIIQETGETFAENAILKAKGYCELTGYWTLADDSGLAVEALGGHPGIHTARYGGAHCAPSDKWDLLLRELRGVVWEYRKAQFCCAMALALPDEKTIFTSEGICGGKIAFSSSCTSGFGYDPIFYIPEYARTMAQISPDKKDRISHRGQAARAISPKISLLLDTSNTRTV